MKVFFRINFQAKSSWKWCSSYLSLAESRGKGRILLNLDESFIPYFTIGKAGNVVKMTRAERRQVCPPAQHVTRKHTRMGFTYAGLIAETINVQK